MNACRNGMASSEMIASSRNKDTKETDDRENQNAKHACRHDHHESGFLLSTQAKYGNG